MEPKSTAMINMKYVAIWTTYLIAAIICYYTDSILGHGVLIGSFSSAVGMSPKPSRAEQEMYGPEAIERRKKDREVIERNMDILARAHRSFVNKSPEEQESLMRAKQFFGG